MTFSKSVDQPKMHKNLTYTFSLQRGVWLASLWAGSTLGSTWTRRSGSCVRRRGSPSPPTTPSPRRRSETWKGSAGRSGTNSRPRTQGRGRRSMWKTWKQGELSWFGNSFATVISVIELYTLLETYQAVLWFSNKNYNSEKRSKWQYWNIFNSH